MSDTKYVWLRFRTRHSSGPGNWQYEEMAIDAKEDPDDEDVLQRLLETVHNEHTTDSEHWRGVEGDIVAHPPKSVLRNEWSNMTESISRLAAAVLRNEALSRIVALQFIPVVNTNGLRAFVPDPELAYAHETNSGYTFEREHALRYPSSLEARAASPIDEAEEL